MLLTSASKAPSNRASEHTGFNNGNSFAMSSRCGKTTGRWVLTQSDQALIETGVCFLTSGLLQTGTVSSGKACAIL